MEDLEEEPVGLTKDKIYIRLTEALVEDVAPASPAPAVTSIAELESRIQVLTFERE